MSIPTTSFYALKKPSGNHFYNIQDLNDNMDIIDFELNGHAQNIHELIKRIDSLNFSWGDIQDKPTLFPADTHTHDWNSIESKPSVFTPSSHTHDDRYFTESEMNSKLASKANNNHGTHIPTPESASNSKFLRNDNTWQNVTPANIGAAAISHTHDDRYFTETEINTKLAGKANSNHGTHVQYGTDVQDMTWGSSSNVGTSSSISRSDHRHELPTLPVSTTSVKGIVQLSTSVSSTSASTAATSGAVRTAYNKGVEALNVANEALSLANSIGVKSIQRGIAGIPLEGAVEVAISSVNLSKSILLVQHEDGGHSTSTSSWCGGFFVSNTRIKVNGGRESVFWQVVEFN